MHFSPQIFDPLSLSDGAAPGEIKLWREAEIKHGRVAMLASLGVIVAEVREYTTVPVFAGKISNHHKLSPSFRCLSSESEMNTTLRSV